MGWRVLACAGSELGEIGLSITVLGRVVNDFAKNLRKRGTLLR
jgi:hypothetical protein